MSSINVPSVDEIRCGFPQPTVPTIDGEPNYETIKAVHDILKSNAAAIPTTLGGGAHGQLGLVLNPAVYIVISDQAYDRPANPGLTPNIPAGSTNAQIGVLTRNFNAEYKTYTECIRTDQALKQLLLGAVEDMYVSSLRNQYTGYTAVTTWDIITHLYDTYGQISDLDLDENEKRIKKKYEPDQPIDVLFKQIEEAEEYATTGNSPFTARQIVNTAFLLIFATGAYEDECKTWKRRTTATKTWANFKSDFMQAYKSRRDLQKLQKQATAGQLFGAHASKSIDNNTAPTDISSVTDMFSQTTDKIEAIANATLESGNQVAFLAQENVNLRAQVSSMQAILADMQTSLSSGQSSNTNINNTSSNNNNDNNRARRGKMRNRNPRGFNANSHHYCHTHGLTRTPHHTSQNCRFPDPGHKKEATFWNKMNGSKLKCHLAQSTQATEDE